MENKEKKPHVLLVIFPGQGHINPALQLAKRLLSMGIHVTFSTSVGGERTISKTCIPPSLSFASFSDGNDDAFKPVQNLEDYISGLRIHGSESLREIINNSSFTCVAYSLLLPWVAMVAREFNLQSVLFWSQAATVFNIYYHYFNGFSDELEKNISDSSFLFRFPGLPPLSSRDLPSFFSPSDTNKYAFSVLEEHLQMLDGETNPTILLNTLDALESEALNSISKYKLLGIGPLVPCGSDSSVGGDLFKCPTSLFYIDWLNSKAEASVIYISFGSITQVSERQMEEIRRALIESRHPFLWVIREKSMEKVEENGVIVPWCNQLEVLSNPGIGCFITHCGWNSTTESLSCGIPVVAFPQWTDQLTNAKLLQDCWKTGVRVIPNEDEMVAAQEIKRCLNMVIENEEMRENAIKWKVSATNAFKEGGSSHNNLQEFANSLFHNF
ncbi:phloretin 4'-O-glucosyltransferase-like [Euphorbia lathyris]|uniref:phloretin 4'-O-glucosyltransferase-like n=1 Tax=Euphorbia lathyris TaxID=212925 RepID=UPI003313B626